MKWIEINNTRELEQYLATADKTQPLIIFKHSTRCSVSRMSKQLFEGEWKNDKEVYLINVVENRETSNSVASKFGIQHESPQILVIKNGRCIYDASHSLIDANTVSGYM